MNTSEFTFKNLFGSYFDFNESKIVLNSVKIPRIQRDYAQGRENYDVLRIREKFLDALFQAIINGKHIKLDFVFGDISEEGILTPLDGQQRLTTLFLLHWYIAKKENIDEREYIFLEHFSYETRSSSREFCQELIKYSPDFSKGKISDLIKDQAWYPYEWKNDPTVQSMLVMLDAIHDKFHAQQNLWKSLVVDGNISFYFLPLAKMGLTDDLYIKMNSRGKPLTLFEHFKAEFEEMIKCNSEELSREFNRKFDIEWTEMLFPFCSNNNIIDDKFMRYFRFISDILCYRTEIEFEKDDFKLAKLLYGIENDKSKDNLEYLEKSFDCWCNLDITKFFDKFFSKNLYESGKVLLYHQESINLFKECCDNHGEYSGRNRKFSLNNILLLFSINTYLQNKDNISEELFKRRIRIIRNLIMNSTFEIRDDRMKTLLSESEKIMLCGNIPIAERGTPGYNERQKEEERNKIEWLINNSEMEDELFHLEDHELLRGSIAIIGLENSDNFKKFGLMFANCDTKLIDRALLSLGDYTQSTSNRFFSGLRNNWITLFHYSSQSIGFDKTKLIINDMLHLINEDCNIADELGKLIINYQDDKSTKKDWRYYFVKYHESLNGAGDGYYIQRDNDYGYDVTKLNKYALNGKNWNVYLYLLFKEDEENLLLDNYDNQGGRLRLKNSDISIECLHDKYVIFKEDIPEEHPIQQLNNVDSEDRIEKGKKIISDLLILGERE